MVVVNDAPTLVHSLSTPLARLSFVGTESVHSSRAVFRSTPEPRISEGTRRTGVRRNNVIETFPHFLFL